MSLTEQKVLSKIKTLKAKLLKSKCIYENFGANEHRLLQDWINDKDFVNSHKFDSLVLDFYNWTNSVSDNNLLFN